VLLADNGEQEGGKEGVVERVDGIGYMLVEQLEIVRATGVWDPGLSGGVGVVHRGEEGGLLKAELKL
jgi:hypothetical protein